MMSGSVSYVRLASCGRTTSTSRRRLRSTRWNLKLFDARIDAINNLIASQCTACRASRPEPTDLPSGPGWVHEIKHDGYRVMVRRDVSGVWLLTRNGKGWTGRFPTIVQAAAGLKARSCLIDGEAVACDESV